MFDPTQDVDFSAIPWELLIRARTADEVQLAALQAVSRAVLAIGMEGARESIQAAASKSAAHVATRTMRADPAPETTSGGSRELLLLAVDLDSAWRAMLRWIALWLAIHGGDPVSERGGEALVASEVELVGAVARFSEAAGLTTVHEAAKGVLGRVAGGQREA